MFGYFAEALQDQPSFAATRLQPEVTRGQKQLQEQRQLAVRAVSAMECTQTPRCANPDHLH